LQIYTSEDLKWDGLEIRVGIKNIGILYTIKTMNGNQRIKEYVAEKNIQPRPIANFVGFYNDDELVSLKNRSNEIRKLVQGYNRDIGIAAGTVDCLEIKEKNPEYNANCYSWQIRSKAKKTETISEQIETETQKLNELVDEKDALLKEYKRINKVLFKNRYELAQKNDEITDAEGSFFITSYSSGSKKRRHRKKTHKKKFNKKKFNKNKSKKLR